MGVENLGQNEIMVSCDSCGEYLCQPPCPYGAVYGLPVEATNAAKFRGWEVLDNEMYCSQCTIDRAKNLDAEIERLRTVLRELLTAQETLRRRLGGFDHAQDVADTFDDACLAAYEALDEPKGEDGG